MAPPQRTDDADVAPPTPRWVKLFGIAALVLVAVVIGLHLTGSGFGPGMHAMPAPQP